jgi:hypothetical protein
MSSIFATVMIVPLTDEVRMCAPCDRSHLRNRTRCRRHQQRHGLNCRGPGFNHTLSMTLLPLAVVVFESPAAPTLA